MLKGGVRLTYLAIFFIYALVGWIIEVAFYLYKHRRFVNRGFLNGPMIPIYGFSALFLHVFVDTFLRQTYALLDLSDILTVFFTVVVVTTLFELIGGMLLLKVFHARWWDYSTQKYNYNGFVCLKYTLIWGVFGTALYLLVHIPFIVPMVEGIAPASMRVMVQILSVYVIADAVLTTVMLFNFKKWMVSFKRRLESLSEKLDETTGMSENKRLKTLKDTVSHTLGRIRSNVPINEVKTDLEKVKSHLTNVAGNGTKKELSVLQRLMGRITSSHLYKGFPNLKINIRNKGRSQNDDDGKEDNG